MASVLRIIDLNGRTINIIKGRDQSWADVVDKANLPKRFDFCIRHWMSDDPLNTTTEEKIKAYLDRVGYILIQDKPDGKIITDYKELRDAVALIPVSGISQLENAFYSRNRADDLDTAPLIPERATETQMTKAEKKIYNALTKPRVKVKRITALQQRRKNIDAMYAKYPGVMTERCVVNTDNEFRYDGKEWIIYPGLKQYLAKDVRGELLYDMDMVICFRYDGKYVFMDMNYVDITRYVKEI